MALSPWLVLYEMRTTKTPEGTSFTFVKTDSLYGNGIHIGDMPIGDAAVVTDTATDTDWLLVMHRLNDAPRTWVLERFDATAGRFTPTGERVTGTDFFEPWIVGHALGTKKPAVAFHVPKIGRVFCFADDLTHPFARWSPQGALEPPVSYMVAINDQSGDGLPDLVAAGGVTNSGVAIYTLDSTVTSTSADTPYASTSTARLEGSTLVATAPTSSTFSVRMVTIDGQSYDVIARCVIQPGEQRIDLASQLQTLPIGVYLLHVQVGDNSHVLRYVR